MSVAFASLVVAIWVGLLVARDDYWRNDQRLTAAPPAAFPGVLALVPARNEAATIEACIASLAAQDYAGPLVVVVVDDDSSDGTGAVARRAAAGVAIDVRVVDGPAKPDGWSGKVAAQAAGLRAADRWHLSQPWIWLTDADVVHAPDVLRRLVATAEESGADLVSVMAQLSTTTCCERWLVPAFVYFFQLLYPFPAVNDPKRATAAAAGGCILIERAALARGGGFAAIHREVIDDVALAARVKATGGRLWLATDVGCRSLRRYDVRDLAQMVARTAFTELRHSYLRLVVALVGLAIVFLAPVVLLATGSFLPAAGGALAIALMGRTYRPLLRAYARPDWWFVTLPVAALAYMAMTLLSAWQHAFGAGPLWHGRSYGRRTGGTGTARP